MESDNNLHLNVLLFSKQDFGRKEESIFSLLKQTAFKDGWCSISIFTQDENEILFLQKINDYLTESKNSLRIFDSCDTNTILSIVESSNSEFFAVCNTDCSLRPDALAMLYYFLLNNSNFDGAYSDFLFARNDAEVFESTESLVATNFPQYIQNFSHSFELFPSLVLVKRDVVLAYISKSIGQEEFNFLNFFDFLSSSPFNVVKLNSILGLKYIPELYLSRESKENLSDSFFKNAIEKRFGKEKISLITKNALYNLPYHFENPNNDIFSLVVIRRKGASDEDYERTLYSISFQDLFDFEIISNKGFLDEFEEVVFRNFAFKVALGKYICFIYAGDEISPDCFRSGLSFFKEREQDKFLYSDYILKNEQRVVTSLDFSFDKLKKFGFIPCYCFFPRRILIENGDFDEFFPVGYSLWEYFLRLGKNGIFGVHNSEPCVISKTNDYWKIETQNIRMDSFYKAKIIEKHKDLFTDMQLQWANSVILNQNLFEDSKVPFGIIPNNRLLTKILINKKEEVGKDMKKVLFVMYGWKETGGGTTFPRTLALELAKRGWDVSVFFASLRYDSSMPPYSMEEFVEDGVKLFGLYNRPAAFKDPLNPEREISDKMVENAFRKVLEKVEPDVVYFHNLHGLTLSLPEVAKNYNLPTMFNLYNYYLLDPDLYMINSDLQRWRTVDFFENSELARKFPEKKELFNKRLQYSKKLINEYIDLVLAVSRRQKQIVKEFSGNKDKIIVVHQINPTVDNLWSNPELQKEAQRKISGRIRFGYLGGLYPTKGVHNFVLAAQYFLPSDAEFYVYGFSGPTYFQLLQSLDKKKNVRFYGEYSHNELPRIAKEIDCAVIPPIYEDPAPFVLTEANSMRLPIIGSEIGGVPDFVVDGVNGFLFDPDDIDSLVSAIRYCTLNPEIVEQMRKNLKQYYSFSEHIAHLEKILNALINRTLVNPKDYELIVTSRLLASPKLSTVKFTKPKILPNEVQDAFEGLGYEIIHFAVEDETSDSFTYNVTFKVPKQLTIEEFFIETEKDEFQKTEKLASEPQPVEEEKATLPEEFSFLASLVESQNFAKKLQEQTQSKVSQSVENYEEKVFDLSDLEQLLSPASGKVAAEQETRGIPETLSFQTEVSQESEHELNVVWEGSQFVYHSLALINREHCSNLIDTGLVEVTIVPYETEQFLPQGNPKYEKLAKYDIRFKEEPSEKVKKLPYLWIRHQWPPKSEPPRGAKWVIMQPWEFSTLPRRFVEFFQYADELWVPSNYTRQAFLNSGLPFNKVQVVPNGIDPTLFQPNGKKYPLPTNKKLKFLFVGGTTYRKGFDILLESFVSAFTSRDDVVLVVKDMGTESVYRGQTSEQLIEKIRNTPETPEIIYYKNYFTEEEMASLYRACDVFVSPYRGEGFSLPTLEAMACGLPVIVTEGGATEDFVLDEFAWKIPSYKISIGNIIDNDPLVSEAFLLEPDGDYLTNLLKSIYQNPADITVRGILASSYARKYWTWKRSTLKLLSRIDYLYGKDLSKRAKDKLVDIVDAQIKLGEAERFFDNGELDKALEIYIEMSNQIDSLSFKYQIFYFLRLAIIHILKSEFSEAAQLLEPVERLEPNNIDLLYLKSKMLYLQGNLVEALEKYTDLVSQWNARRFESVLGNSLDVILVDMANIMFDMGDIENSLQLFTEALKLNDRNVSAYLGSAKCFIKVKDYEEARRMLDWVLKLEPENQEANQMMEEIGTAKAL
jgi:glycosyltransferase involved in cell wall biosynthesis